MLQVNRIFAGIVLFLLIAATGNLTVYGDEPSTQEPKYPTSQEIWIQRDLHTMSASGEILVVPQGIYRVEVKVDEKPYLHLISQLGKAINLRTVSWKHEEEVKQPHAIWAPTDEDEYRILLLLPDGTALEAIGSETGVTTRAVVGLGKDEVRRILAPPALARVKPTIIFGTCGTAPTHDSINKAIKPGDTVVISGRGFCDHAGQVSFVIGNRTFPVAIYSWSDTRIQLLIPSSIIGVKATREAELKITTEKATTANIRAAFEPTLRKYNVYLGWWAIQGTFQGVSEDRWMGSGNLINDYKVVDHFTDHRGEGHCKIVDPPPFNKTGVSVRSKVHMGIRGGTLRTRATCKPYLVAEGPAGFAATQ